MALSGSTNFNQNRTQIINKALRVIGVYTESQTPSPDEMSSASDTLNMMLKAWAADGLQLTTRKSKSISLSSGTSSYTLGPSGAVVMDRPIRILKVVRKYTDGTEVPIDVMSQDNYQDLNNKTSPGLPTQWYYDPQLTNGVLYIWPVTDQSGYTLEIIYIKQYDDLDTSTDDLEFPQEWYQAIYYGLADLLAEEYGVPDRLANRIHMKARRFYDDVMGFDVENSSSFIQPDMRYY